MNIIASAGKGTTPPLTRIRSAEGSRLLSVLSVMTLTSAWVAALFLNKKLIAALRTRSSTVKIGNIRVISNTSIRVGR